MSVILLLIPLSLAFAGAFLAAFFWAVRSGQYEDTGTPPLRLLGEERRHPPATVNAKTLSTNED